MVAYGSGRLQIVLDRDGCEEGVILGCCQKQYRSPYNGAASVQEPSRLLLQNCQVWDYYRIQEGAASGGEDLFMLPNEGHIT